METFAANIAKALTAYVVLFRLGVSVLVESLVRSAVWKQLASHAQIVIVTSVVAVPLLCALARVIIRRAKAKRRFLTECRINMRFVEYAAAEHGFRAGRETLQAAYDQAQQVMKDLRDRGLSLADLGSPEKYVPLARRLMKLCARAGIFAPPIPRRTSFIPKPGPDGEMRLVFVDPANPESEVPITGTMLRAPRVPRVLDEAQFEEFRSAAVDLDNLVFPRKRPSVRPTVRSVPPEPPPEAMRRRSSIQPLLALVAEQT